MKKIGTAEHHTSPCEAMCPEWSQGKNIGTKTDSLPKWQTTSVQNSAASSPAKENVEQTVHSNSSSVWKTYPRISEMRLKTISIHPCFTLSITPTLLNLSYLGTFICFRWSSVTAVSSCTKSIVAIEYTPSSHSRRLHFSSIFLSD